MWTTGIVFALVLGVSVGQGISLRDQLYKLGYANNYFAVNLHRKLSNATEGNVFFSPFSVSSVLSMLYKGARGETAEELRKALGYRKINDSTVFTTFHYYLSEVIGKMNPKLYTMNCVSAMIIDNTYPVFPDYKTQIQDIFQAYIQDANIAEESAVVVDKMNTWAKIKTKGAISNLAESIDPGTSLFLASAAYFKGAWKIQFDPKDTKKHPFYNRGDKSNISEVSMMHAHTFVRYFEEEYEDFTAVELFYEGRNVSMVIYLPKAYDGLREFEMNMTVSRLINIRRQMYFMKVHLTMPKFKLEVESSLSRALKGLGLSKLFRFGADLSGMIPKESRLALDEVKHVAMIEVNERGTVAAAITRAVLTKSMPLPIPDPEFKADHPFLFAIFDIRSNMILFMGRISDFMSDTNLKSS